MKAAVHDRYGDPGTVTFADLPKPVCPEDGYLVRVKACSVNPADWKYIKGNWKWITKRRLPRQIGTDFSGVVESAGRNTSRFQPGDAVMGSVNPFKTGTAAEYVSVHEGDVSAKPESAGFDEAAALPIAGGTAYLGIAGSAYMQRHGSSVLVTGAGGGVGHLAVQLAVHMGGTVTAVCSAEKHDFVRGLGADSLLDYRTTDLENFNQRFDVIMDCAASLDYQLARNLLKSPGEYILLELNGKIQLFAVAAASRIFMRKSMRTFLASPSYDRCLKLKELVDNGALHVCVGGRYRFEEIGAALDELKAGHATGKIVVEVS